MTKSICVLMFAALFGCGAEDPNMAGITELKGIQLGNQKPVPPALTIGPPAAIVNTVGPDVKLLDVNFPDGQARELTISLITNAIPENAGTPFGPIIGIVQWGVGGSQNSIEFNIPNPARWGGNGATGGFPIKNAQGGCTLSVNASNVQVLARNDQNLPAGLGPNNVGIGAAGLITTPQVGAFIAEGTGNKQCGYLTRVYPVAVSGGGNPFTIGSSFDVGIPAFAKRVRIKRLPLDTTQIDVFLSSATNVSTGPYILAPGEEGPIELSNVEDFLSLQNNGTADCEVVLAVFELEL